MIPAAITHVITSELFAFGGGVGDGYSIGGGIMSFGPSGDGCGDMIGMGEDEDLYIVRTIAVTNAQ